MTSLGLLAVFLLVLAVGSALIWLAGRLRADEDGLTEAINNELPQTQCAQCGYPGCRPYAAAIAANEAAINRCPPGGDETIAALAQLLGREPLALAEDVADPGPPRVAVIDEPRCIGCVLCIDACPVAAIVGARSLMHTVIAHECTGCDLCVPACPVDCIEMVTVPTPVRDWVPPS